MSEKEIVYDNGACWVHEDRKQSAYVVYVSGVTHSVSDSGYAMTPDGLSIAIARANYLAKRKSK